MTGVWCLQVREQDLSVVVRTLEEEFNIYREVGGDSLPLHSHDRCNSLQPNGSEGKNVTLSRSFGSPSVTPSHSYVSLEVVPSHTDSLQITLNLLQLTPSGNESLRVSKSQRSHDQNRRRIKNRPEFSV